MTYLTRFLLTPCVLYLATVSVAVAQDDPHSAGRFDDGKMWTFDFPPTEYLKETYGFEPDAAWYANARLGALRIPGCSASLVSSTGLVMTNHHCARSHVTSVMREGEELVDDGFYAATLEEERPAADMWADQLIAIHDVTEEVDLGTDREVIEARLIDEAEESGVHVEFISLFHGAKTSAYVFRRFEDVRLVMAPELQLGYYGGDWDNFTYPRYALDVSFFRVYENGSPFETESYFAFSDEPIDVGDLVFAIGNPGSTFRLETVAQLEYRHNVREGAVLDFLESRAAAIEAAIEADPDHPSVPDLKDDWFSLLNGVKLYQGRVRALADEMIMARRKDTERKLIEAIEADSALHAAYGGLHAEMAEVQAERTSQAAALGAFFAFGNPSYESSLIRRAVAMSQGSTDLSSIVDKHPDLERGLLIARLRDIETWLGPDHAATMALLRGSTPEEAASTLLAESALATDPGDVLPENDVAVEAVATALQEFSEFSAAMASLQERESALALQLGRARFAVYGTQIPPDATFSLRLADGVVRGYEYNGTIAPPYTTFYGLYDHYWSYGEDTDWDLPDKWKGPPSGLDLGTPLNFVTTSDITGGNSGSPIVNEELEVVGLVFDGNIESLSGDFIYLEESRRCVAVAAAGILEALRDVYHADRIVEEIETHELPAADE